MNMNHLSRRDFMKTAGIGSLAAGYGFMTPEAGAAAELVEPMRIVKVEMVKPKPGFQINGFRANWVWVRLHTDNGIVGLGESYPGTEAHIGMMKELANRVIRRDPTQIERMWQDIYYQISYRPVGGADFRMLTAINIAQWDILGKAAGMPVYKLLGGMAQEELLVYNTMNGWPLNGIYEYENIEKITEFLLSQGLKGIKIYPYDRGDINPFRRHKGTFITKAELDGCLDIIKRIRKVAGDQFAIALDLSSKFNLPVALQIANSLEPYGIAYLEDVMLPDNIEAYQILANQTSVPICNSERLGSRFRFRELFDLHAVDVCMYDVTWCGGISEAKKISDMADTYKIPTSPHTGGGPVLWFSSIHVATSLTNFYIMESVYHLYNDLYPHFIKDVPRPVDGVVKAPERPGLGIELKDEPFENGDLIVETIAEA